MLLAEGLRPSEIARRLEVAGPTVDYHLERLGGAEQMPPSCDSNADSPENARRQIATREQVRRLLKAGNSRAEAARELGLSKAVVSYHARLLGLSIDSRCARRYDWTAVQSYYDAGHSVRQCVAYFGFSSRTWQAAVRRGAVVPRPVARPLEQLLVKGAYRSRQHLKARLLSEGVKDGRCEECGLAEWRGRTLSLALHHVNGDRLDHRLENLRLLCGNCHSQTDNFSGRNRGRANRAPRDGPAPDGRLRSYGSG